MKVVVVDYGSGNLASAARGLQLAAALRHRCLVPSLRKTHRRSFACVGILGVVLTALTSVPSTASWLV